MSAGPEVAAAVEAANTAFYEAIEAGDLDAMRALWLDDEEAVCVHPGTGPVRGSAAIGRSWALIMANTPYIQFFLTDVETSVREDTAVVTCVENVLTAADAGEGHGDAETEGAPFGAGSAVATNVYVRDEGVGLGWRLWIHHSSPVLSTASDQDDRP